VQPALLIIKRHHQVTDAERESNQPLGQRTPDDAGQAKRLIIRLHDAQTKEQLTRSRRQLQDEQRVVDDRPGQSDHGHRAEEPKQHAEFFGFRLITSPMLRNRHGLGEINRAHDSHQ
jgi:hypothetical protein